MAIVVIDLKSSNIGFRFAEDYLSRAKVIFFYQVIPITSTACSKPKVVGDLVKSSHPIPKAFGIRIKHNTWVTLGCLKPGVKVNLVEEIPTNMNAYITRMYWQRPLNQINHTLKRWVLVPQQIGVVLAKPA